ncbi:hypothetical protein FBPa8_0010 [Pseudomonas phage vB_PaeP_FBPa8]|nr:hypothetical protein FBPa8_0010 [Pseudomonas phage vB_PaeP_FBPa8]
MKAIKYITAKDAAELEKIQATAIKSVQKLNLPSKGLILRQRCRK